MNKLAIVVLVVAILLISVGWAATAHFPNGADSSSLSASTTSASSEAANSTKSGSQGNWLSDVPAFVGSAPKIDYPPDYGALANFTLGVINSGRGSAGLAPVILSTVPSAQQHADSMAYYGYFSHWDNQGYKPYMRYTLLGGTGGVTENIALNYCNTPSPGTAPPVPVACSVKALENAINASEWEMMNNDTACCNNGHRENILGPLHNRVSVGIAYNSTAVYLVEDFEDSYITSGSLRLSSGVVIFNGSISPADPGWLRTTLGAEITVYFDPTPSNISLSALDLSPSCVQFSELNESASCQFQGAYNPGTEISTVFAPCPAQDVCSAGNAGNYTFAESWQLNPPNFSIVFSISGLELAHGNGVYTFYLWPEGRAPEPITSLSVFVTGQ
jgi:uncharacterized protein YkwD